jgi:hypothetical protein
MVYKPDKKTRRIEFSTENSNPKTFTRGKD